MVNNNNGSVLAVLLARHDMNHDNWATVAWARVMVATSRDLHVPHALTDHAGRPIVDALPRLYVDVDVYGDDARVA
jgi:hypothetical protein